MAKLAAASSRVHIVPVETQERLWRIESKLCQRSCTSFLPESLCHRQKTEGEGKSQQGYILPKRHFSPWQRLVHGCFSNQNTKKKSHKYLHLLWWPEIVTRNPRAGINSDIVTWRCWESPLIFLYTSTYRYRDTYRISIPPKGCLPSNVIWCAVIGMCHFNTWTHGWFKNALGSPFGYHFLN